MSVARKLVVAAIAVAVLGAFAGPAAAEEELVAPEGIGTDESFDVAHIGNFDIWPKAKVHTWSASDNLHRVSGIAWLKNWNDRAIKGHCRIEATFMPRGPQWSKTVVSRKAYFRAPGINNNFGWGQGWGKMWWPENGSIKLRDDGHHYYNVPELIGRCHAPDLP